MTAEIDIWRAAKQLIDWKGLDSPAHAAARADELLAAGDRDGHAVWLRIGVAVAQLLMDEPDGPRH